MANCSSSCKGVCIASVRSQDRCQPTVVRGWEREAEQKLEKPIKALWQRKSGYSSPHSWSQEQVSQARAMVINQTSVDQDVRNSTGSQSIQDIGKKRVGVCIIMYDEGERNGKYIDKKRNRVHWSVELAPPRRLREREIKNKSLTKEEW